MLGVSILTVSIGYFDMLQKSAEFRAFSIRTGVLI